MASKALNLKKNNDYWSYLEENYREVSKWPTWMRGEKALRPQESTPQSEETEDEMDKAQDPGA